MNSSRSKAFSGKKKKEQLQLKKQIKNQKLKNDSLEENITSSDAPSEKIQNRSRKKLNLLSDWNTVGSGQLNPRDNPEYQSKIEYIDFNWRESSFEQIYGPDSSFLSVPTRPKWDHSLSIEELESSEQAYFQSWLTETYAKSKNCGELSFFEHNIEVWRQLWRVCEISNVLIAVADMRNPVAHLPSSFCSYVMNTLKKPLLIALTKSDLVSKELRDGWKHYLSEKLPGAIIHFVSTFDPDSATDTKEQKRYIRASGIVELLEDARKLCNCEILSSQWESIIKSVKARVDPNFESSTTTIHVQKEDKQITIGFIGQPNVGKSSLINSIFGKTVVSASKTPGHTKHFQTLHLSSGIRVCDSPGLIFPSIIKKNLQILSGVYNIAQVKDPYGPILFLSQRVNMFKVLNIPESTDPHQPNSVFYICEEYAKKIGFFTSKAGRPDTYRAANYILRQVISGKILLFWIPPGFDDELLRKEHAHEFNVSDSENEKNTSEEEFDANEEEDKESFEELKNFETQFLGIPPLMGLLNFEEQLAFYGQYHNNAWNRVLHIIFVPIIFWTFFVWLSMIPTLIIFDSYTFNVSFAIIFLYIFYYILLEPVAGAVYAPCLLILAYSANVFAHKTPNAFLISFIIQVISWSAQFFGHFFFEKRAPALLDNVFQAFLLAPLFIFMEFLFVLGYRPALLKRIRDKTKISITTWKMGKDRRAE